MLDELQLSVILLATKEFTLAHAHLGKRPCVAALTRPSPIAFGFNQGGENIAWLLFTEPLCLHPPICGLRYAQRGFGMPRRV